MHWATAVNIAIVLVFLVAVYREFHKRGGVRLWWKWYKSGLRKGWEEGTDKLAATSDGLTLDEHLERKAKLKAMNDEQMP